jgi:hypothetical protein
MLSKISNNRVLSQWVQQCFHAAIAALIFVLSEWIFTITKPSILSITNWGQKFLVLFHGFIFFSAIGILSLLILYLISLLFSQRARSLFVNMGSVVPAAFLASTILLMIDNFTYTVFRFGIVNSQGIGRGIYLIIYLVVFYFCFRFFLFLLTLRVRYIRLKVGVLLLIVIGTFFILPFNKLKVESIVQGSTEKLPNIILMSSDGVSASHMSAYDYERQTTPNIDDFKKDSLFVENNFTNSANTVGSYISVLTGKYPTKTRVLYPPDMLRDIDAFEHLPAILKSLNYYNVQLGVKHYVDAYSQGILNGFDEVNGQIAQNDTYIMFSEIGFNTTDSYFLSSCFDRISERLLHIFFMRNMVDSYELVTQNDKSTTNDKNKIENIFSIIDYNKEKPLFIQVHLMGTHGPKFSPGIRVFSANQEQTENRMTDFYDDSILYFDHLFGNLIDGLNSRGILDNTIIVLFSDHGMGSQVNTKTPLIIRFPDREYKGTIVNQAQNLDIAPTILSYLNIEKPEFMEGQSIIEPRFNSKPIISVGTRHGMGIHGIGWMLDENYLSPPFYQFDYINLVHCQNWYRLELEPPYNFTQGEVKYYLNPCSESELLIPSEALAIFKNRLTSDGFDIPSEILELISPHK